MSLHLFHFHWQAMQFDECKKQLQEGDVMFIMDFSTNYSHHKQSEIHGAFWCRRQTTFHPIIKYYLCPQKCDHLVCDEILMVSKDVKHDSFAVDTFVDKALSHLKEKGIPVKRIIMWSDNCGTNTNHVTFLILCPNSETFQLCVIISVQNMERLKQMVPLGICPCT